MYRAVVADHILFDECIYLFRPDENHQLNKEEESSFSYLLTSFELPTSWELPNCKIHPSITGNRAGSNSVFICKVDNPKWCNITNSNLYGIALAAIVTFVTGRPCKSTRHFYFGETLTPTDIIDLATTHPILIAGPGATSTRPSAATLQQYQIEIAKLISRLYSVPYPTYVILMQAIRLIHLSQVNKRDDFGLAYLLAVSAIEAVAQKAINKKALEKKHPLESEWSKRAKEDSDFGELFGAYKEARSKNQFLKERFVEFINKFAPSSDWENIVPHQFQDYVDSSPKFHSYLLEKQLDEKYPSDLSKEEITKLISDLYTHRSCFIHRGEQPPHQHPLSYNRFFQEHREYKERILKESLLPNYELLIGIARHSITGWLATIKT